MACLAQNQAGTFLDNDFFHIRKALYRFYFLKHPQVYFTLAYHQKNRDRAHSRRERGHRAGEEEEEEGLTVPSKAGFPGKVIITEPYPSLEEDTT